MKREEFTDVRYEVDAGLALITIDRPERYNAFRGRTVDELIFALKSAWADRSVGVVALTGAGDKAFCAGAALGWMRAMAGYSWAENQADAAKLAEKH